MSFQHAAEENPLTTCVSCRTRFEQRGSAGRVTAANYVFND
ncbi:hypothetical protein [Candidatus Electronema sp. TJ]